MISIDRLFNDHNKESNQIPKKKSNNKCIKITESSRGICRKDGLYTMEFTDKIDNRLPYSRKEIYSNSKKIMKKSEKTSKEKRKFLSREHC